MHAIAQNIKFIFAAMLKKLALLLITGIVINVDAQITQVPEPKGGKI